MKRIKLIIVFLIMILAISPVLAANCVTLCAAQSMINMASSQSMTSHCHKSNMLANEVKSSMPIPDMDHSGSSHKSCTMGAGCHFAQVTPLDVSLKFTLIDNAVVFSSSIPPAKKSADLFPPLKPPA